MKNFLAIDTSSEYLTIVASQNGQEVVLFEENCAMQHSTKLMPKLAELLRENGFSLADFDFFSCVVGAGSFTGLRIGIATIKGFCSAMRKPALPITTFELMAYNTRREEEKILAVIDALHDCYYVAGYEGDTLCYPPAYLTKEEVLRLQKEGYTLCAFSPLPFENLRVYSPSEGLLDGVKRKAKEGGFGDLVALYIRKSQAEINLQKGEEK